MIPQGFKPLLADKLPKGSEPLFPCYVSPKLDGIRAHVFDGVVYSRKLKPIPNAFAQKLLGRKSLQGFDGELTVGSAASSEVFRAESADGIPKFLRHEKICGRLPSNPYPIGIAVSAIRTGQ
jgi:DNA ligase-1